MKMTDWQRRHARIGGTMAASIALLLGACTASADTASPPADIPIAGEQIYPESMDSDAAGNIYVGSNGGTIYRAEAGAGEALPWIVPDAENGLQSLYGVLVDEPHGLLWTCSNPDLFAGGANAAPAALKAFDLASGKLAASYDFPAGKPTACNDIAIAADGSAFATETISGRIFQLAPGADAMTLFAEGQDLVGVDGIAFADDGTMYINNVRQNLLQRVERGDDGAYAGLTTLTLSQPVSGPDALRPLDGNRFLQAEGPAGRIAIVTVDGDKAEVTTVKDGFDSTAAATRVGGTGYTVEGKIAYRVDPALKGKDPGPFIIRAFALPEGIRRRPSRNTER